MDMKRERQQFLTVSTTEEVPRVPSTENKIPQKTNEETNEFLGEKRATLKCNREINIKQKRELVMEKALNYLNQMSFLDNNAFAVFEKNFQVFMNKNNKDLKITGKKRKFENQTHYPQEKKKRK